MKPTLKQAFLCEASSRLSLDEETGRWAIKGEDGFRYDSDGKLAGAEHLIAEMREKEPDWFQSSAMQGSGFQGSGSGGDKRTYTRAEYDALVADPAAFEKDAEELRAAWREGRVRD